MPKVANEIFVNVEKVEKLLNTNKIPQTLLGEMMGLSRSWWAQIKRNGGRMSQLKAVLLSKILNADFEYITRKDNMAEKPQEDHLSNEIQATLSRIEKAIADLAGTTTHEITRLQIQMREILKELGV